MKLLLLVPLIALANCSGQRPVTDEFAKVPESVAEKLYPSGPPPKPKCSTIEAEFLVTQNSLRSELMRRMEVYLAPTAFDEKNLRSLFECLSKENPEPEHLIISLETDWSRVHIPDGRPGTGASGGPRDPHENDFLRAMYYRRPEKGDRYGKEYFRYSPRIHLDQFHFTTVSLKK